MISLSFNNSLPQRLIIHCNKEKKNGSLLYCYVLPLHIHLHSKVLNLSFIHGLNDS